MSMKMARNESQSKNIHWQWISEYMGKVSQNKMKKKTYKERIFPDENISLEHLTDKQMNER